jgi:hypothetical protein
MVGDYWAALDLCDRDVDDANAARLFKRAAAHAGAFRASGEDCALVDSHILTGLSIEDDGFVLDRAPAPPAPAALEMLCGEGAADPAQGVFFAAADAAYFKLYARDCARSLAALGPGRTFHVHVVGPDAECRDEMEAIRADNPGLACRFSIEAAHQQVDAVYYACARFLHLPSILERYRTPVAVTDIDGIALAPVAGLPQRAAGSDLAFFRIDTAIPWLKCHAALIHVGYRPGGIAAAATIDRFLRRKLAGFRNWTLDQAALFCVDRALRHHRPEIRIADLAHLLGADMAASIAAQGSFEEKRALRLRSA